MFGLGSKNEDKRINVILIGPGGMLGHELNDRLMEDFSSRYGRIGIVKSFGLSDVDASNRIDLTWYINDLAERVKWDYVVNCAAFTDTCACEDWRNRDVSYDANAVIPLNLAKICHSRRINLVHVSTNEVFSHSLSNRRSSDTPHPTSVYGMEKYLGEFFIRANMDEGEYAILRTSWLYGMHNSKSFIHKCVKVFENARKNGTEMFGIDEEISIPTDVSYLSTLILNAMIMGRIGIFNAVNSGEPMSRLGYMRFILSNLQEIGEFKELNPNDIKKLTYDDCPSLRRIGRVVLDSDDSLPLTIQSPTDCREQLRRFIRKNGLEIVNWARKDNGTAHGKAQ